jgi:hypothetical protein
MRVLLSFYRERNISQSIPKFNIYIYNKAEEECIREALIVYPSDYYRSPSLGYSSGNPPSKARVTSKLEIS